MPHTCRFCNFVNEYGGECNRCFQLLDEVPDNEHDAEDEVPALFGVDGLNLSSFDGDEPGDEPYDESDAESDDPRDGHDDDLFGAYEELTKSMMANLERDFVSLAAAAAELQPAVARSCGAIMPKMATVDDVTDAMHHMTVSPSKRLREKTEFEPTLVESPSKRHRGKQAPSLVVRRNPKLCQHADCVFSRRHPGSPAWCPDAELCQFCDPTAMAAALQDPGQAGVRHTPPVVLRRSIWETNGPRGTIGGVCMISSYSTLQAHPHDSHCVRADGSGGVPGGAVQAPGRLQPRGVALLQEGRVRLQRAAPRAARQSYRGIPMPLVRPGVVGDGARRQGWPSAPIAELVHDLLQGQDCVRAGPAEAARGVQR